MKISNGSANQLDKPIFKIKPSRIHLMGFIALTGILLLALISCQFGLYLSPLVLYWAYEHYQQYLGVNSVSILIQENNHHWSMNGHRGFKLCSSSCIRRYWAVLIFTPFRAVAIFPDSLGKEEFRRLRVASRFCSVE